MTNTNIDALLAAAQTAHANNLTFLSLTTPTNAQAIAQIQALTRQIDNLGFVVLFGVTGPPE